MSEQITVSEEKKKGIEPDFAFKTNKGKTPYNFIPFDALEELGKVYQYGDKKYPYQNWRKGGIPWSEFFDAMCRHLFAWWRGEKKDNESGCHHLSHVAWGCLTLLNYETSHPEMDDRVKDLDLQEGEKAFQFKVVIKKGKGEQSI